MLSDSRSTPSGVGFFLMGNQRMGRRILLLIALLAAFACARMAHAEELRLLSLDRVAFDAFKIANNRDPYYPYADPGHDGEHWDKGAALLWDVDVVRYGAYGLYWRNRVEGAETNVQFRQVYWAFEGGLEWRDRLQLYYSHRSEHLLDESPAGARFPLHNTYGARITFYSRDRK